MGCASMIEEVPVVGAKAAGVKAINLKDGDQVAAAFKSTTPACTFFDSTRQSQTDVTRRYSCDQSG